MSQMRKWSSKVSPSKVTPEQPRGRRRRAARRRRRRRSRAPDAPSPFAQVTVTPVVVLLDAGDLVAPADVDQRLGGDLLVEELLGLALRDVHERRERRAARGRRTVS